MSQLTHALVRALLFAGIMLFLSFVGYPIASELGLRLTDWKVLTIIFFVFFLLLWLFNRYIPAICRECGKNKSYCDALSFIGVSYKCQSCGARNSAPLHK